MPLVLVRVDCRLIHGQVIEAWLPFTGADCLVVANDEVAGDFLQKSIMTMAVPPTIEIAILGVREAADALTNHEFAAKRIMLLFANCQDALECHRLGLHFDRLNLGNLVCTPGKTQITCSISLDQRDVECLKQIRDDGVQIDVRSIPQDTSQKFSQIVTACP